MSEDKEDNPALERKQDSEYQQRELAKETEDIPTIVMSEHPPSPVRAESPLSLEAEEVSNEDAKHLSLAHVASLPVSATAANRPFSSRLTSLQTATSAAVASGLKKVRDVTTAALRRPKQQSPPPTSDRRHSSFVPNNHQHMIEVKPWSGVELGAATATVVKMGSAGRRDRDASTSSQSTVWSTASSLAVTPTAGSPVMDTFDKLEPAYRVQNIRSLAVFPTVHQNRRSSLPGAVAGSRRNSAVGELSDREQCRFFPPSWRQLVMTGRDLPMIADVIRSHESYLRRRKMGGAEEKKGTMTFGLGL
jgi:hypothetical protein